MVSVGEVDEELEDADSADEATAHDGVLLPVSGGLNSVSGDGLVAGDLEAVGGGQRLAL